MIYLDHCATTPLSPAALKAMQAVSPELPGNPSSIHAAGRASRRVLELAREQMASLLGVSHREIVFTASASEANNLAVKGIVFARSGRPTHLIVAAIEHHCVLRAARFLANHLPWVSLTEIPAQPSGEIDPEAVAAALRPETALIALMHANHETGVIQPVAQVARIAHSHGAILLTDAVQSLGRVPVSPAALGCDMLSLAGHKCYGPPGIGLLWARSGTPLEPLIHGGSQENNLRAGTENPLAAFGMATAAGEAIGRLEQTRTAMESLKTTFLQPVLEAGIEFQFNGDGVDKVPGVMNLSVAGLAQDDLVVGMDVAGVAISAGSACSSGVIEPSHVLQAMGLDVGRSSSAVRISFGRGNSLQEASTAGRLFADLCIRLGARIHSHEERQG